MRVLDELDLASRSGLEVYLARIKHDLGKYIAFQIRWLPPDASFEERVAALRADLLETRRGPDGSIDACTLWMQLRPCLVGQEPIDGVGLVDLSNDDGVRALDQAMVVIAQVVAALNAHTTNEATLERGFEAAHAVAEACRTLHQRARN